MFVLEYAFIMPCCYLAEYMTRAKKKLPSVAGRTFTPIKKKKPQKDAFHPDSYRSRKQKGLASKKKQKSVYQKFVDKDAD